MSAQAARDGPQYIRSIRLLAPCSRRTSFLITCTVLGVSSRSSVILVLALRVALYGTSRSAVEVTLVPGRLSCTWLASSWAAMDMDGMAAAIKVARWQVF